MFGLARYGLRLSRNTYRYLAFGRREFRGAFRGVFDNFDQAEAAAPPGAKIGFNHKNLAQEYRRELRLGLSSLDFPILFYLHNVLKGRNTVLDFGGNIGVHFLRYRKYLNVSEVRWIVCDVPEIAKVGLETCKGISNVAFVSDVDEIEEPVDILLASGSIQYVASSQLPLRKLIDKNIRPKNIFIDQLPLYDGQQFVTLQNGGLVCYPQYVFNQEEFIGSLGGLGYELIDFWDDDNVNPCVIPFHPDKSIFVYKGLYLRHRERRGDTNVLPSPGMYAVDAT